MRRNALSKVICFRCRRTDCRCVADHSRRAPAAAPTVAPRIGTSELLWAIACLAGAGLLGTVLGVLFAMLFGA